MTERLAGRDEIVMVPLRVDDARWLLAYTVPSSVQEAVRKALAERDGSSLAPFDHAHSCSSPTCAINGITPSGNWPEGTPHPTEANA